MEALNFNIWSVLIVVCAIHGFLIALVLWKKQENQQANAYFALLLLALSLHLLEYSLDISGISLSFPHIVAISYPLLFVLAPLYYFYGRALMEPDYKFRWKGLLHFMPSILVLLLFLPFYLQSAEEKLLFLENMGQNALTEVPPEQFAMMFAQIIQLLIYLWFTRRIIKQTKINLKGSFASTKYLKINWLEKATLVFGVFVLFYGLMTIILVFMKAYRFELDYIVVLINALLIFGVAYAILSQPQLFVQDKKTVRRANLLGEKEMEKLKAELIELMRIERPYLEEDIKISDLAQALNCPSHHLSELINTVFKTNFFDFINQYRIEAAKALLKDQSNIDMKILAIAFETGFNNKATFNRVFKKYTGQTPSAFRNEHLPLNV